MALWRTSTALALLALVAGGCGHDPSASSTGGMAAHPQITPVQQQPLTVQGTGFQPGEKVELSAKGLRSSHTTATADAAGEFEATLHGLKAATA